MSEKKELKNISIYKRFLPIDRNNTRTNKVIKGSYFMLISSGISAFARLGIVVILAHYYSKEEFGIWSAITATAAVIATGDFGITNALRNKVSQLIVFGEMGMEKAQSYFYSSIIFFTCFSLLLSSVLYILSHYLPFEMLFKTDNDYLKSQGVTIILWVQFLFLMNIPVSVGGTLFFSFQESHYNAIFSFIQSALSFSLVIILSLLNASIVQISVLYFLSNVLVSLASSIFFIYKRRWFNYRCSFKMFVMQVKELFMTGIKFMGIQLSSSFLQNAGTIAASSFLSINIAAEFNMITKLYSFATGIYQSIFNPFWGGYADAVSRKDWHWCKRTLWLSTLITFVVFILFIILSILFGNYALNLLAGAEYETTCMLLFVTGFIFLFYMLYASVSVLQHAINKLNIQFFSMLCFSFIIMPISEWTASIFGLKGIIIVSMGIWLFLFIISLTYSQIIICRNMKLR